MSLAREPIGEIAGIPVYKRLPSDTLETQDIFDGLSAPEAGQPVLRPAWVSVMELANATDEDYRGRLPDVLQIADDFFAMLARPIGGTVIDHTWVLLQGELGYSTHVDYLAGEPGAGLSLGVQVPYIAGQALDGALEDVPRGSELLVQTDRELKWFSDAHVEQHRWNVHDACSARQFMTNATPAEIEAAQGPADLRPVFIDFDFF